MNEKDLKALINIGKDFVHPDLDEEVVAPTKPAPIPAEVEGLGKGSFVAHLIDRRIYWYFHYYDPEYITAKRKGDTRTIRRDPVGWNQKSQSFSEQIDPLEDESQTTLESVPVSNIDTEKVEGVIEALTARVPVQYKRHKNSKDAQAMERAIEILQELL